MVIGWLVDWQVGGWLVGRLVVGCLVVEDERQLIQLKMMKPEERDEENMHAREDYR